MVNLKIRQKRSDIYIYEIKCNQSICPRRSDMPNGGMSASPYRDINDFKSFNRHRDCVLGIHVDI